MLQLVLLLIANALDGTIGQRGKWNGLVMLDEPPTGGQDYCRCCNIGKERVADRNREEYLRAWFRDGPKL